MKNILIAATIVGAVAAGLIIYLRDYYNRNELDNAADDISDAAGNAMHTMNKHIRKVERATEPALHLN